MAMRRERREDQLITLDDVTEIMDEVKFYLGNPGSTYRPVMINAGATGSLQEPTVGPPMTPAIQPPLTPVERHDTTGPTATTTAAWVPTVEHGASTIPFDTGDSAGAAHQHVPSDETRNWSSSWRSRWSTAPRHTDRWDRSATWWTNAHRNDADEARQNQSLISWQSYDGADYGREQDRWNANDDGWNQNSANQDGWEAHVHRTPYPAWQPDNFTPNRFRFSDVREPRR